MTEREAAIITAYTGCLIGSFGSFHKYAEEVVKRPIMTAEFGLLTIWKELKKKSIDDWIVLHESIKESDQTENPS